MALKILHLIGQMERGGAERQLLYLTEVLRERGWQQAVITFNPGDAWDNRLAATGVPLFGIARNRIKPWRLWQLTRRVWQERPDIVHSWSTHTNVYAHWLFKQSRLRRIFSLRGNPASDRYTGKPITRIPNLSIYAQADCVVSNSRKALERAQAAGARMRRSEIVGNIVVAEGRGNPGETEGIPRIAAAGDLIPLKGYDVLLRALGQLAANGRAFELLLAGEGPEKPRLQTLAETLGIRNRIKFLGSIEDVPALLSGAHLLVHPSRSEGLSNTILEAMAEGLPVVATSVGGTPELIHDGKTGLLVPSDSAELLTSRISQLLESPRLRVQLGKAGLKSVRKRYSTGNVTAQYETIYRSVVSA